MTDIIAILVILGFSWLVVRNAVGIVRDLRDNK